MNHTERLHLREWLLSDAEFHRELWSERDDRVPPHRRIDADGHPTVAELADAIRADASSEHRCWSSSSPRRAIGSATAGW